MSLSDKSKTGTYLFSIIAALVIITTYAMLLRLNCNISYQDVRLKANSTEFFGHGFMNADTGELVADDEIIVLDEGDELVLVKKLPNVTYKDRKLSFQTNGVSIRVYADDVGIYTYGLDNSAEFGKEVGLINNVIDLMRVHSGQELKIIFKSYKNHATINMKSFIRGTDSSISLEILRSEAWIIFGCVVAFVWGVILIGCGIYFRIKGSSDAQEMSFIGFFATIAAAWMYTDSTLMQFSTGQMAIRYQASYYLFTVMIIPLVLIFRARCEGSVRFLTVCNCVLVALLILDTVLYMSGIMALSDSLYFTYFLIDILAVAGVVYLIREVRVFNNKRLYAPMVFFAMMVVAALIDIYLYNAGITDNSTFCFKIGLMIFIMLASASCFKSNSMVLREKSFMSYYRNLAFEDSVTGGHSQYYFTEEAERKIKSKKDYVLVYFDLQQFKLVNDTVGRHGGDKILKLMYDTMSDSLISDECMCHMGGGHFLFLLKKDSERIIHKRLLAFKKMINKIPVGGMEDNRVNAIAGVYYIDDEDLMLSEMIDRAIIARNEMRMEIIDGFGCAFFDDAVIDRLKRDNDLKNRMLNGMKAGEFRVFLQPKVDPMSGRVRGAEALARWMDPVEGMISPGEFIPVFENNGSIIHMNLFMLKGTIRIINSWIEKGITPPIVSVNLSKISIHNPLFMDEFTAIMEDDNTPVEYLEFEFTENMLYESAEKMNELVGKIHEWGSTCSIDDFGCNYSNLTMLKEIPVDMIKLDRDFLIYHGSQKERAFRIVETIVKLSHELSMGVVMEGVETEEQAVFIRKCGCDMIQGFYYSRPLPEEEFEEYLIERNCLE